MPRTNPLPPPNGLPLSLAFHYPQLLYTYNTTLFSMWLFFINCLTLKMKALQTLKTLGTSCSVTHRHILGILGGFNFLKEVCLKQVLILH
jgi:hypothetical protein